MRTLITLVIVAAVAAALAVAFAYSGFYDVSASSPHSGPVKWLLTTTSDAAIERQSRSIEQPGFLGESLAQAGANDFDAMCVDCHGAPGKAPAAVGQGLNPPAPDLAESAEHMTPAELFWVTKHGIKMTGMPAWGATHDDASLWPVVAFVTRLPDLDADGYAHYVAAGSGLGHHAGGGDHDDHDHGEVGSDDEATPDGHDHEGHHHEH